MLQFPGLAIVYRLLRFGKAATDRGDLIAIGILHVGAVEVWVVLGPESRNSFTTLAVRWHLGMEIVHCAPGGGL